jgi:hypothetical protein
MTVMTMKMLTPRRLFVREYEAMLGFCMRWKDDTSNYVEKLIFAHMFSYVLTESDGFVVAIFIGDYL